jgi:signal transduction histidine kinase
MLQGSQQQRTAKMQVAPSIQTDFNENRASGPIPLPSLSESWQRRIYAIGRLSTSIVHDLRNPLTAVFAGAEMLVELDSSSNQVKRLAGNIYRAADRMRELLADLADASCGKKSRFEICKIRDIIIAALEAVLPAEEQPSVQILNNVPCGLEIPLHRLRIERVFFNVIANSVEAMPRGGTVRIGGKKEDNCVLIEIEDTGPGIPLRIRDRLFEPFVTAGKEHGLGLGLALSRQTVLDHGGDMWIEPAAGARFVVRLPLEQHDDDL